jgi:hypothetical protein
MLVTLDSPGQALSGYSRPADPYLLTSVASIGLAREWRDKWRMVVRALEPLRRLRDNWDGLGAAAPSAGVVDTAIDLASHLSRHDLPAPTTVAPTPAGTILFTWDNAWDEAQYWELEIRTPNWLEWMQIDWDGAVTHGEFPGRDPSD